MLRLDMHMIAGVLQYVAVASFAEAWIEKSFQDKCKPVNHVASFAEAWIEKVSYNHNFLYTRSPPSRRRGLKIH